MVTGMGSVGWSGIMPDDVANLTWFQVRNDYMRQWVERSQLLARGGKPELPKRETQAKPTREQWVRQMRKAHPKWTLAECHADYDKLLRVW